MARAEEYADLGHRLLTVWGWDLDLQEAADYFNRYFPWYNEKHYHSAIDYVTPEQCHQDLREIIVSESLIRT